MKNRLSIIFVLAVTTVVSATVAVGMLLDVLVIRAIVGGIYTMLASICLMFMLEHIGKLIRSFLRQKKKIRTSEKKVILFVTYRLNENPSVLTHKSFQTKNNLARCVHDAIAYARKNNCTILRMYQPC